MPLILLLAICVTGLMLTPSYTWTRCYGYDFLDTSHAVTVIFTLLWLDDPACSHYQRICPACRRRMLGLAHGALWEGKD